MTYHADFWVAVTAAAPVIALAHAVTVTRSPFAHGALDDQLRSIFEAEEARATAWGVERAELTAEIERLKRRTDALRTSANDLVRLEKAEGAKKEDEWLKLQSALTQLRAEIEDGNHARQSRVDDLTARLDKLRSSSGQLDKQIAAAFRARRWLYAAYIVSTIGISLAFVCFTQGVNSLSANHDVWKAAVEWMITGSMLIIIFEVNIQMRLHVILRAARLRVPQIM